MLDKLFSPSPDFPKAKIWRPPLQVRIEDPQRLSRSQLRIPESVEVSIEDTKPFNRNLRSYKKKWIQSQLFGILTHPTNLSFFSFLRAFVYDLSCFLFPSVVQALELFTTNSIFLFSSIVKRNLRAIVKKLFSPSGFLQTKYRIPVQVPIEVSIEGTKVCQSQPRIPNHVTKILRSHKKKRDPKLFGILTYSASLSNFFF